MNKDIAVFGTGCFWCSEAIFKRVKGVISVESGYAGGTTTNPTYESVCTGMTGHAEVIKIEFDPTVVSYNNLLEVFWKIHDPTTLNRQGNDVGTQYRSLILYNGEIQKVSAEKSKENIQGAVTEIKKLETFYPAEDYHKDYFAKYNNQPYCRWVILPKLKHFEENDALKDLLR